MSLRDQLIAKGLVSKKQARKATQDLKKQRKKQQGSRRRAKEVAREEAAARKAESKAAQAARDEARASSRVERDAHEQVYRVRQIIRANRMGGKGPVPFWHRQGGTTRIGCLHVKMHVARDLRSGRAAIAEILTDSGEREHHVVPRRTVDKLREIDPEVIVHFNEGGASLDDPSEVFLERTWEPSLIPHRVRDDAA